MSKPVNLIRLTLLCSCVVAFVCLGCSSQQSSKPATILPNKPGGANAPSGQSDSAVLARVKKLADECGEATMKGNYQRVIELSHDTIVSAMGGPEQAVATLKAEMEKMASEGGSFLSYHPGEPGQVHVHGKYSFSVVPNVVYMKINGNKVKMPGYMLGISPDQGATWKFADNNALEDQNLRRLIPPLPPGLKLPAPVEPTIVE